MEWHTFGDSCKSVDLNNDWICLQGSDAFSQSGLYSNHQDIGPRYAVSTSTSYTWQNEKE